MPEPPPTLEDLLGPSVDEPEEDEALTANERAILGRWNETKPEGAPSISETEALDARKYMEPFGFTFEQALTAYGLFVAGRPGIPPPDQASAYAVFERTAGIAGRAAETVRAATGAVAPTGATLSTGRPDIDKLVNEVAGQYGIDPNLLMGFVIAESGGDPDAHNPGTAANPEDSWGLLQLNFLGGQGQGFVESGAISGHEDVIGYPEGARKNLELGAQALLAAVALPGARNLQGQELFDFVAVNSGHGGIAGFTGGASVAGRGTVGQIVAGGFPPGEGEVPQEWLDQATLLGLGGDLAKLAWRKGMSLEKMAAVKEASAALDLPMTDVLRMFETEPPERIPILIDMTLTRAALAKTRPTATEQEIADYAFRSVGAGIQRERAAAAFGAAVPFDQLQSLQGQMEQAQAQFPNVQINFEDAVAWSAAGRSVLDLGKQLNFQRQYQRFAGSMTEEDFGKAMALGRGDVYKGLQEMNAIRQRKIGDETLEQYTQRRIGQGATAREIERSIGAQVGREVLPTLTRRMREEAFEATRPAQVSYGRGRGAPAYEAYGTPLKAYAAMRTVPGYKTAEMLWGQRMKEAFLANPKVNPALTQQLQRSTALGTEDVFAVGAAPQQQQTALTQELKRKPRSYTPANLPIY